MSEMKKAPLTLQDIKDAQVRIKPYVNRTPLLREEDLDAVLGCKVYFKPEMLQRTGAFKARGAFNKVLSLTEEERQRGIIFSSSGNHAAACAYVGKMFGIKSRAEADDQGIYPVRSKLGTDIMSVNLLLENLL